MKLIFPHTEVALSEQQKEYIERKIAHLKKLAGRYWSEASLVEVELRDHTSDSTSKVIETAVKMPLPGSTLFAKVQDMTVEAAIDKIESKLEQQIATYKGKHERKRRSLKDVL